MTKRGGNLTNPESKYTLCVPGIGTASSKNITDLSLSDGNTLSSLVFQALSKQNGTDNSSENDTAAPDCVWLDITSPTIDDICALTYIFGIDTAVARKIIDEATESNDSGRKGGGGMISMPIGGSSNTALYMCYAETSASEQWIKSYLRYGTSASIHQEKTDNTTQSLGGSTRSVIENTKHSKSDSKKSGKSTEKTTAVPGASVANSQKYAKMPSQSDSTKIVLDKTADTELSESTLASTGDTAKPYTLPWTGGYVPVPPWLQPSATQVLLRFKSIRQPKDKEKTTKNKSDNNKNTDADYPNADCNIVDCTCPRHIHDKYDVDEMLEAARQERIKQLLTLLNRPRPATAAAIQSTLQKMWPDQDRWKPTFWGWKRKQSRVDTSKAAELIRQSSEELIGHNTIQIWTCGPILLTFHLAPSCGISKVITDITSSRIASLSKVHTVSPRAITQGLVEHWLYTTQVGLNTLNKFADELDRDLTRPLAKDSNEAAEWTPIIARCRRVALALLRHCQLNNSVLLNLCQMTHETSSSTETIKSSRSSKVNSIDYRPNMSGAASESRKGMHNARQDLHAPWIIGVGRALEKKSKRRKATRRLANGIHLSIKEIVKYGDGRRLETLWLQYTRLGDQCKRYKENEQRMSRLHKMLLERQRLRLLSTQQNIQQYFRRLVTLELIILPIELWYNVDNLNGITTPGVLQENESDADFWWTAFGLIVWAVVAIILYTVYTKFFAHSPDILRAANIRKLKDQRIKFRGKNRGVRLN